MTKKELEPNAINQVFFKKHHHSFLLTLLITLSISGAFAFSGYLLDQYLNNSKPIAFIILLVIGFPVTQMVIYVVQKKYAIKKLNSYKNGK